MYFVQILEAGLTLIAEILQKMQKNENKKQRKNFRTGSYMVPVMYINLVDLQNCQFSKEN